MTRRLKRTGQVAGGWGDSTHRPLGIPQGRWGLLGTTPRRECGRQPGSRGVGPAEGSSPGQGQPGWGGTPAEAHTMRPYSECVSLLGLPQMSQRVEGCPDTKAWRGLRLRFVWVWVSQAEASEAREASET